MKETLAKITEYYLGSRDFNGLPIRTLDKKELGYIEGLVKKELISINFGDRHPNSYINAFDPEPSQDQLDKLKKLNLEHACAYPTRKHLKDKPLDRKYDNKPFTTMLARGEPQLSYKVFDISVLEPYRNDPRYYFDTDEIHGSISIRSDYYKNGKMRQRDEAFIQTFGFAYNKTFNRAVAVYTRYLSDLTPEHQQQWFNKMLRGKYLLHPDYFDATMGKFPEKVSIFTALTEELYQINKMCNLMGKPQLFREEFKDTCKPRNFGFLIRPTLKEYESFVLTLDKMLSDNINKEFFKGDIPLQEHKVKKDGSVEIIQKATITLLEEWLKRIRFPDPKPKDEMIKMFREVRKQRQPVAHTINEDMFDQKYFKKQRDLMIETYGAIRTLRLIFANHPNVKGYKDIPEWLFKGDIRTF